MPRTLNLAFFAGVALLAGIAWGMDGYQNPRRPKENRFLKYVQAADPWAEFRPAAQKSKAWWEDSPIVATAGKDPSLRHLPIFHFKHTDGHDYFVQAKNADLASFMFTFILEFEGGRYLPTIRGRTIQQIGDIYDPEGLRKLPPPPDGANRAGLFDDIPSTWPDANRASQPLR